MRRGWRRAAGLLACVLAPLSAPGVLRAHDQPFSFIDLTLAPGVVEGRVAAHVVDLAHEAGLPAPDSLLAAAYLEPRLDALRRVLGERLAVVADGETLRPRWRPGYEILADRRLVALRWRAERPRPAGEVRVAGPLFRWEGLHQTYLNVYQDGRLRHQDLLDRQHGESVYYTGGAPGVLAVARTFVAAGVHHIFIGPDHVLFIVGLLLLGGRLRRLLAIVTSFTVAHSLTLALATLELVNPPPRLVEPAIALSILYVGVDNLLHTPGRKDARAWIAFGFGFVHGFGFAGVLRQLGLPRGALGWSLASFNLGVELGQAAIVLGVAPLLALIRARSPKRHGGVVTLCSWCVALAGGYWFVRRVFLP